MNTNELRIGNILTDLTTGKPVRFKSFAVLSFVAINQSAYAPIQLTKDILLKCGFEKYDEIYEIKAGSTMLSLTAPHTLGEWQNCFCWVYDQYKLVHIPSLHQLQNLYFALTGEELTIKNE